MSDTAATAQVVIRPPLAWALAVIAGFALDWLMPLPFVPAAVPAGWLGGAVIVVALALFAWAIATIMRAGSNVPTNRIHRRHRALPLHAQSHLPRHDAGARRSRHRLRQPLAAGDARALRRRHPLRRGRAGGSLSRAQVRRGLSPLPRPRAALAVALSTSPTAREMRDAFRPRINPACLHAA
jgi:hypothetical protein